MPIPFDFVLQSAIPCRHEEWNRSRRANGHAVRIVLCIWGGAITVLCGQSPPPDPQLEVLSDDGHVSVEWKSRPGRLYRLQENATLADDGWQLADGNEWIYGLGQQISYGVHTFTPTGGPGDPLTPRIISAHFFTVSEFSNPAKWLISWQGDYAGQVLIDHHYLPANLPPFLTVAVDLPPELALPENIDVDGLSSVTVMRHTMNWQPAFLTDSSLAEANLSPGQSSELARLFAADSALDAAISGGGAGSHSTSTAGGGPASAYRLQWYWADTDGDGIPDWMEFGQTGTDPFHPDSDRDGFLDGDELAFGGDPTDPSITINVGLDTSDFLQRAVIKLTGDDSSLTVEAQKGDKKWPVLLSMAGPNESELPLTRGVIYHFQFELVISPGFTGTQNASLEVEPKAPETDWKWHLEMPTGKITLTEDGTSGTSAPADDKAEKTLVPAEIVPADDQPGKTGDQIPSINAENGEKHYVSPKADEDPADPFAEPYVILKAVEVDEELFDEFLEWECIPSANGSVDPYDSTKFRVKRDATGKTTVKLNGLEGGEEGDRMNVWVIWANLSDSTIDATYEFNGDVPIPDVSPPGRGSVYGAKAPSATYGWQFVFDIEPKEIVDLDQDIPNLRGENVSEPPGASAVYAGGGSADTATKKWDVSRRMRITFLNPSLIPSESLEETIPGAYVGGQPVEEDTPIDFPEDPVAGNDDSLLNDERVNPYEASSFAGLEHDEGQVSSFDIPTATVMQRWGAVDATFAVVTNFQEFVRLELVNPGRTGGTKWFRISDYVDWHNNMRSNWEPATPTKQSHWADDGSSSGYGHVEP